MSVLTTTPLTSAPSGAAGVTLTTGIVPTWGAWVEVIASTATPIAIAGVQVAGGSYTNLTYDLDIGLGAAAAEVSLGTVRLWADTSGTTVAGPDGCLLPVPLGGIGSGARVSVRARSTTPGGGPTGITLLTYANFDSAQVTTSSQVLSGAPPVTVSATITPDATGWVNSAWVELLASAATDIGLLGLVHETAPSGSGFTADGLELDLGIGAAAAETVLTTLRDANCGARLGGTWLPGIYPLTAGTRVSCRLRKAGTDTAAFRVSLLYYTNVSATAAAVETVQAFVWMP